MKGLLSLVFVLALTAAAHAHGHGVAVVGGNTVFVSPGFVQVQAVPVFVPQAVVVNHGFHNQAVVVQNGNAVTFARTGPFGVTRSTQLNGDFTRRGPLGFSTTFQSNGVRVFRGPLGNVRGIR